MQHKTTANQSGVKCEYPVACNVAVVQSIDGRLSCVKSCFPIL